MKPKRHTPACIPPDEVGARGYCVCPHQPDEDDPMKLEERSDGELAESDDFEALRDYVE